MSAQLFIELTAHVAALNAKATISGQSGTDSVEGMMVAINCVSLVASAGPISYMLVLTGTARGNPDSEPATVTALVRYLQTQGGSGWEKTLSVVLKPEEHAQIQGTIEP